MSVCDQERVLYVSSCSVNKLIVGISVVYAKQNN